MKKTENGQKFKCTTCKLKFWVSWEKFHTLILNYEDVYVFESNKYPGYSYEALTCPRCDEPIEKTHRIWE